MRVQNNKNYSKITQNCVNDVNSDRDLRQVEYLNLVELKMNPGNRITERDDEDNNIGYISLMGVSPVGGSGGGGDNNDNLRNSYILCNCDCKCVMDKICGRKGVPIWVCDAKVYVQTVVQSYAIMSLIKDYINT